MNKSIYIFALLFTASTLFIGCNTDEPNSITVADSNTLTQTVYADQNKGENTVRFTTTAAWTSSIIESRSTATWLSITPSSGNAGTHNITLNLQPNTTGANRSAIITITSNGATIEIRITQQGINAPIAVTGVTLAGCNLDTPLAIGNTRQLTATVLPEDATNPAVTWASSHNNIATVDTYGLVTAHREGTATITATTVDGGRTATCVVTVIDVCVYTDVGVVINGIRWATRNVDAPGTFAVSPIDLGMLYTWSIPLGWTLNPLRNSRGDARHEFWSANVLRSNIHIRVWSAYTDPCPSGWRLPEPLELRQLRALPRAVRGDVLTLGNYPYVLHFRGTRGYDAPQGTWSTSIHPIVRLMSNRNDSCQYDWGPGLAVNAYACVDMVEFRWDEGDDPNVAFFPEGFWSMSLQRWIYRQFRFRVRGLGSIRCVKK